MADGDPSQQQDQDVLPETEAQSKEKEEARYLDKFDHLSSDKESMEGFTSSDDDLEQPILARLEKAKQKKKLVAMVPDL